MRWSRLWWFLVALFGALALALLLLVTTPVQRDRIDETGRRLARTQKTASLLLLLEARQRIDVATQVSNDVALGRALEQADRSVTESTHRAVQEQLRLFQAKRQLDLLMATDSRGRVVARVGREESVFRDSVEGFPLVADALRGLRGDDTWSLGGKLYWVAAAPMVVRDRYVGSLVVGQEVTDARARAMKEQLEADLAFFLRGRVVATTHPGKVLSQLARQRLDDRDGAPLWLPDEAAGELALLTPLTGDAQGHEAAYALLLPAPPPDTLSELAHRALVPQEVPWRQGALWGCGLLLVVSLGFSLMQVEASAPLRRLAREAEALARREATRLGDYPGAAGTIARALNATLDRLGAAVALPPPSAKPAPAQPKPKPEPPTSPPPVAYEPIPALDSALDDLPPSADFSAWVAGVRAEVTSPPVELAPELVPLADSQSEQLTLTAPRPFPPAATSSLPASGASPSSGRSPSPAAPPPPPFAAATVDDPFGGETAVARPSQELLRAAAPPPPSPRSEGLEHELQQVYREFIDTKQACGEATDGITYDKFSDKLRSNRQQLIARYACKAVRFEVYVKNGKAALKATPIPS